MYFLKEVNTRMFFISYEWLLSNILLFLCQSLKTQIFFLEEPTVIGVTGFITEGTKHLLDIDKFSDFFSLLGSAGMLISNNVN